MCVCVYSYMFSQLSSSLLAKNTGGCQAKPIYVYTQTHTHTHWVNPTYSAWLTLYIT